MDTSGKAPGSRYHHGALRQALLEAGLALMEREGPECLTLRSLATAVGVSHAAPAHHFATLTGLRTALAAIGYHRFGDAMAQACAGAAGPEARLREAGRAYLAFALRQPGLFRLMFTKELLDWTNPDLAAAAAASRAQLSNLCGPAAKRLRLAPAARPALEHLVWAAVHGQAQLAIDGQWGPSPSPADLPGPESGCPDIAALLFRRAPGAN
jgi:AcrR family transcriptional regulator